MPTLITILIFLAVITAVIALGTYMIRKFLRDTARNIFGTNTIKEGLNNQAEILAKTPKSVSSMTRVYLPLITEDFPQFNLAEFKQRCDNMVKSALLAISEQNITLLESASDNLKNQISLTIENDKGQSQVTSYKDIIIHQTEITKYVKAYGLCVITLQSAIEFKRYVTSAGKIISGSNTLADQTKYNIELAYVQNEELANAHTENRAIVGIKCPSCGANVTNLGAKQCDYCGSQVKEINLQVWSFNKLIEVPSNIV